VSLISEEGLNSQVVSSFDRIRIAAYERISMTKRSIWRTALSTNRDTNRRVDCVKLREPYSIISGINSGEDLWPTKKNARTRRARARHKKVENTVALHAKARVIRSNWIAIAVTKRVREIFKENLECADRGGALDSHSEIRQSDPKRRRALLPPHSKLLLILPDYGCEALRC
jgi:hypothetical protein